MAATITEQLTKLNQLRQQLAANLTTKGVTATTAEKFNTLVPKVLEISGGESPTTTVLSATLSLVSCCTIILPLSVISILILTY